MNLPRVALPAWMQDAACVGVDPEAWFPHPTANAAEAKAVCRSCPVQAACLNDALERETADSWRWGIWGGLQPEERAALARGVTTPRMQSVPCETCGEPAYGVRVDRLRFCAECTRIRNVNRVAANRAARRTEQAKDTA